MPSSDDQRERALAYLRDEFGVEELPGRLVRRGEDWWLTTAPEPPQGVRVHSLGVRLLRGQERGLKPTSFGLMLLGPCITKGRVELTREELLGLLLGRTLRKEGLPTGYVALSLCGEVVGCGHVKRGVLRCQIPRGRRQELLIALQAELRAGV